jgi:hypothetical protein
MAGFDGKKLSEIERQNLLIKLKKEFAGTGAIIPNEVDVEGKTIRLKALVFEMSKKRGKLTSEDENAIENTITLIKKKRLVTLEALSKNELTDLEAKQLFGIITGIDRAINTLYMATEPPSSIEEEIKKAKIDDGKRWLNMLKKIYSREDKRKSE